MNIFESFRLAAGSIIANKMRSLLTMLGMIIGVASVIMIVGLMNGVSNYILDSFADLGTDLITVNASGTGTRHVSEEEMFQLVEDHPEIFLAVTPKVTASATLKNGTASLTRTVTGVAETDIDVERLTLSAGRFISYSDVLNRSATCVVGTYIVNELFENNNVIGKTIKINGENFKIVGVIEETEEGEEGSADDCIYAPYSKIARISFNGKISAYTFSTHGREYVTDGEDILDEFLYGKLLDEDLYTIVSMTSLLTIIDDMMGMLSAALSGIAGISLVVAGIGIMNIMLVSVTERTQEIGIRKSLGARKKDILLQFMIEAGSISATGGIIGIILGSTLVVYIGKLLEVRAAPTFSSIMISFSISVAIGLIFGLMPARKAAGLNPIDALRSE